MDFDDVCSVPSIDFLTRLKLSDSVYSIEGPKGFWQGIRYGGSHRGYKNVQMFLEVSCLSEFLRLLQTVCIAVLERTDKGFWQQLSLVMHSGPHVWALPFWPSQVGTVYQYTKYFAVDQQRDVVWQRTITEGFLWVHWCR